MTRGHRTALTLVEVVIVAAIGTVVISASILVYDLSGRSRRVTASAHGLQTAMMVEEHLENDLGRLVTVGSSPVRTHPDDPSRIAFLVYDTDAPSGKTIAVRGVRYSLATVPGLLQREWKGRVESVGVSPLTSLAFHPFLGPTGPMVRVNMTVGRGADEPAGEPLHHSFLTRIVSGGRGAGLAIEFREPPFLDERDHPTDQPLPMIGFQFPGSDVEAIPASQFTESTEPPDLPVPDEAPPALPGP